MDGCETHFDTMVETRVGCDIHFEAMVETMLETMVETFVSWHLQGGPLISGFLGCRTFPTTVGDGCFLRGIRFLFRCLSNQQAVGDPSNRA